jgi:hypothetical protein
MVCCRSCFEQGCRYGGEWLVPPRCLVLGDDTKAKRPGRLRWDTPVDSWSISDRQLAHRH